MATLKEIIKYSKENPNTDYARQALQKIQSGEWDEKAKEEKIDLTFAGREDYSETPMPEGANDGSFIGRLIKNRAVDVPSDFMDVGENIRSSFKRRTARIGENIVRRSEDGTSPLEAVATGLDIGGATLATLVDSIGEAAIGVAKIPLSQEQEDAISNFVQEKGSQIASTRGVQSIVEGWNSFEDENPEAASNLKSAGDFASALLEITGLKFGAKAAKETAEVAADVIKRSTPAVREAVETGAETVKEGAEKAVDLTRRGAQVARDTRVQKAQAEVDDIVGKIVQGRTKDIEPAKRALSNIDTQGVKTYAELNERVGERVQVLSTKMDEFLTTIDEQLGSVKADELTLSTKVGERVVEQNFVKDALQQLDELYEKINDPVSRARIQNLSDKLDTEGLLRKEINDIAIEYNVDFGDRAFSKVTGDPLTSINAQAFENTRKGVKQAVRGTIKGDTALEIDTQISDLLTTRRLVSRMDERVNQLWQRVQKRGLLERLSRGLADVVNIVTFNTLSGFLSRLLPSNVGLKTLNALDLERLLNKNLKKLDSINKIEDDDAFVKALDAFIRSTED